MNDQMQASGFYFKIFLNDELKRRCLKNSSYSLRSFAKALALDASNLSKYMTGQRQISSRFYGVVKEKLNLKFETLEEFERDYAFKNFTLFDNSEDIFTQLGELQAAVLAEMLSLTTIIHTIPNLSKATGYSEQSIKHILQKMEKVNLVECSENGIWKRKSGSISYKIKSNRSLVIRTSSILAGQLVKNLQVAHEDFDQTHITGVISTDSKMVEEVRERMKNYRRELIQWLENSEKKDTTFGIYLSMFPIIKTDK